LRFDQKPMPSEVAATTGGFASPDAPSCLGGSANVLEGGGGSAEEDQAGDVGGGAWGRATSGCILIDCNFAGEGTSSGRLDRRGGANGTGACWAGWNCGAGEELAAEGTNSGRLDRRDGANGTGACWACWNCGARAEPVATGDAPNDWAGWNCGDAPDDCGDALDDCGEEPIASGDAPDDCCHEC